MINGKGEQGEGMRGTRRRDEEEHGEGMRRDDEEHGQGMRRNKEKSDEGMRRSGENDDEQEMNDEEQGRKW